MNPDQLLTATAGPEWAGKRLDQAATQLFPGYSRARLQAWIRSERLTVDGSAARPNQRLAGNEVLRLDPEPDRDERVEPQDIPLDLLHEDSEILVVNKPAGLVVHPAAGNPDGTLQNGLLYFDPDLAGIPRAGIVHRLDKDTTGAMVVARTLTAHADLVQQLRERRVARRYLALVRGEVTGSGTVDAPIGRHPKDRKRMAVVVGGKPAVSRFRVRQRWGRVTLLEVSLETGRTHQIRVHMAHVGHPLIGDPMYARRVRLVGRTGNVQRDLSQESLDALAAFPRQALHAHVLELDHPADGRRVSFTAPIPADLQGLFELLNADDSRP